MTKRKIRKRIGAFLLESMLAMFVMMLTAYGMVQVCGGQFSVMDGSRIAMQAQQLAHSKMMEVNATSYDNVADLAESLTEISGTEFSREVIVGSESTNSSGYSERTVTVNIYKTDESSARFSLSSTVSSSDSDSSSSVTHGKSLFTSSGSFTVPSGITTVWVSMSGGGGGGGGGYYATSSYGSFSYGGGGGGGAAAYMSQEVSVTAGESITVTIGSKGSAGAYASAGGAGGTTSFGSYLSCAGGKGGSSAGSSSGGSGGSAGGTGGVAGGVGIGSDAGGVGGGSIFGSGGLPNGKAASGYGGGGAGNLGSSSRNDAGGAGSAGFVLVEW